MATKRGLFYRIRTVFLAGLLVVVPTAVSIWVLALLVRTLESVVKLIPAPWRPEELLGFPLPGLGIVLALSTVMLLGLTARTFLGRALINAYERILARVPVLSSIYIGVKELMEMLLSREHAAFEKVVLAEWPRKGLYSVGFQTGSSFLVKDGEKRMVNVFLPTTPNPTTGFYFILPEDHVIATDMTVEQGFKLLMSAGIVAPLEPLKLSADGKLADLPPPSTPESE